MKKLVNDASRYVPDAVEGMLATSAGLRQIESNPGSYENKYFGYNTFLYRLCYQMLLSNSDLPLVITRITHVFNS